MSQAIENLQPAQKKAMAGRPKVGGFPFLAETLRRAGVTRNLWYLPSGLSPYLTKDGPVVSPDTPLASGMVDVSPFDKEALIVALRPIKPEKAHSLSSWRPHGGPASCATMSIL